MSGKRGKPSKRDRLLEAIVEMVVEKGYGGVSVAVVIERAEVARATFYEQFNDKEECFTEALEQVAKRLESSLEAALAEGDAEKATEACLGALVGFVEADQQAARFLFLESLGGGQDALERRDRLRDRVAGLLEGARKKAPEGPAFELEAQALVGGVFRLLAMRLRRGESGVEEALVSELASWARCYAVTGGDRSRSWKAAGPEQTSEASAERKPLPATVRLSRGRHRLSGAEVERSQRERILTAVSRLSREKGYTALTVAEITAVARVSRNVFYALFRDKRHAAGEANELFFGQVMSACAAAYFAASGWPERVWATGRALVEQVGADPERSHLAFVECHAIGSSAVRHAYDRLAAFTLFLEEGYQQPAGAGAPKALSEVFSAAIFELTYRELRESGATGSPGEILGERVYLALAPFLGPQAATEFVEEKMEREGKRQTD